MNSNPENGSVQQIPLTQLAEKYGTPLYVYDAEVIENQIKTLNEAFSGIHLKLKYACKALSNLSVLKLIQKLGVGLDAVSIHEVNLGLQAGFVPDSILFTPNGVEFEEIEAAISKGIMVTIDNLYFLEKFGKKYGSSVPLCVRLNPHLTAGGHAKIQTGHIDSKFGISISQLKYIVQLVQNYELNVKGLHIHSGSDFLDPDVFLLAAEILFDAAVHFPNLTFLDFGSGFKVAYQDQDIVTDVFALGKKLVPAVQAFQEARGAAIDVFFEPGKFIVSEAGYLLTSATVVKATPASTFVGVNSGLNHLIRPMMYDAYHHIINLSNPEGPRKLYNVVGYICETDTFGYDRQLNEVRPGDVIAFKNAGAYGFSMSSNYNSRPRPAEVLVYKGKDLLIRQRENFEDIIRNQIEVTLD